MKPATIYTEEKKEASSRKKEVLTFILVEDFVLRADERDGARQSLTMSSISHDSNLPSLDKYSGFVFYENYEIIGTLGSGGFSNVYKVKHNLDEKIYAVKCVKYNRYAVNEVQALAGLKHPNVIQYYSSLLQYKPFSESVSTDDDVQFTETSPVQEQGLENSDLDELKSKKFKQNLQSLSKSFDNFVIFEPSGPESPPELNTSAEKEQEQDYMSGGESSESSDARGTPHPVQDLNFPKLDAKAPDESKTSPKTLYIFMEFCDGGTLTTWINERNYEHRERTEEEATSLFDQIVCGMKYIHSQNIIHRDLKPDNIFFGQDGNLKIADFGLSTFKSGPNGESDRRTMDIGTETYMSPEQKEQMNYDESTDIFSLGLIWFELLWRMSTMSERNKELKELRNQTFPDKFCEEYKTQHKYIKLMLSNDPTERPNAEQLEDVLKKCFPTSPSNSDLWEMSALCANY